MYIYKDIFWYIFKHHGLMTKKILCAICYFTDSLLKEIDKRIEDAFDIFDHESNKTVDVRLVLYILYKVYERNYSVCLC